MEDDDDDLYGGESTGNDYDGAGAQHAKPTNTKQAEGEEGEAMEDESDDEYESDDVNFKIEKDDNSKPKPTKPDTAALKPPDPDPQKRSHSRDLSGSSSSPRPTAAQPSKPRVSQPESSRPGTDYPGVKNSSVDPIAPIPDYTLPNGQTKPLTNVDFDADLAEHTKPWRLPGTDQSEYFNYGFDEFTWAMYCLRQKDMRNDIAAQKDHNKQFEMMFSGGGMPGLPPGAQMPGMPQAPQQLGQGQGQPGGMVGAPDMNDPMFQQMMQQMMANGVDPSQMDLGTFQQYQAQAMQQGMGWQMVGNPNVPQGAPAGPSGGGQGGYGDGGQSYGGGRGGRRQRQRGGWQ